MPDTVQRPTKRPKTGSGGGDRRDDPKLCHLEVRIEPDEEQEQRSLCGLSSADHDTCPNVAAHNERLIEGQDWMRDESQPCPNCRRPVCPDCRRIALLWLDLGIWEGPGRSPRFGR